MRAEERLWRAVIAQAFNDACLPVLKDETAERQVVRSQARAWLTKPSRNLTIVCGLAGEEPSRVQALAKKLIAQADAEPRIERRGRSRGLLYEHDGKAMTLKEWASHTGISVSTLHARLRNGCSLAEALTTRSKAAVTYEFNGKSMTLAEWSRHTGIKARTLAGRLELGWSIEQALTAPLVSPVESGRRSRAAGNVVPSTRKPPKATTEKRGKERWLEFRGESHTIAQWARITGINHRTIRARLAMGWSVDRVLSEPVANVGRGVVEGFAPACGDRPGVLNARSNQNRVSEDA
jgi:hypothetical protein